jgi:hypothetical protein
MKQIITLLFAMIISNPLCAEVAKGVLEKYRKSNALVCVGIYSSSNLAYALDADYVQLYVVDEDQAMIDHAKIIFPRYTNPNNKNLKFCEFYHGNHDSFQTIMNRIHKPATIILGNCFPDVAASQPNDIMHYLDIIQLHGILSHAILIDYINYAGTPRFGNVSLETIVAKLLEINPYYKLYFERGGILANEKHAILVAYTLH